MAARRIGLSGTPADVIGRIEYMAERGVTEIDLGGPLGPDPAAAIRLMGEAVISWFR